MKKISVFIVSILLLSLSSCTEKKMTYYTQKGSVFHTIYHIKYQAKKPLEKEILERFKAFNNSVNPFEENSIITKVNRNEPVVLDSIFEHVFKEAGIVYQNSQGYFDVTCAPFVNLWGFGFEKSSEATTERIDSIKAFVGYDKVHLIDHKIVKDDPRLELDFASIAKGYSSDYIADLLEKNGVKNYMVEIGGEVVMKGVNDKGVAWRIGINKPQENEFSNKIEEVLQLNKKGAIATSGNYRNFYYKDGKRYAHTINPLTGYPAESTILSATVVASTCMTADAYATAFMAMGYERAKAMAEHVPNIDYFLIVAGDKGQHKLYYSKGIVKYMPNRKELSELENP